MSRCARWIRLDPCLPGRLGSACAGFARAQPARAAPTLLWSRGGAGAAFALVVPLLAAPGRVWRWAGWALAPCVATLRRFGERAYLEGDAVWLGGRRIAGCETAAVGASAVMLSQFPPRAARDAGTLETVFRERLEAQNGWQFDNSWPSAEERAAIADALVPAGVDAQ